MRTHSSRILQCGFVVGLVLVAVSAVAGAGGYQSKEYHFDESGNLTLRTCGNDVNNCGSCGNICTNTVPDGGYRVCNNGACESTCGIYYSQCGSSCVNTGTDVNNCGGCGNVCTAPLHAKPFCVSATPSFCYWACDPPLLLGVGYVSCGDICTNTTTDASNCGTCGHVCPAAPANGYPVCAFSGCTFGCNPGYVKCGGILSTAKTCTPEVTCSGRCGSITDACGTRV
jgi:hypothetical protein